MRTTEEFIEKIKSNYELRTSLIRETILTGEKLDRNAIALERKEDETLLKALMFEHVHTKQANNKEKLIDSKANNLSIAE